MSGTGSSTTDASTLDGDPQLKGDITGLKNDVAEFNNLLAPILQKTPEKLIKRMDERLKRLQSHLRGSDRLGGSITFPHSSNEATTGVNPVVKKLDTLIEELIKIDIAKSLATIEEKLKDMENILKTLNGHLEK